MPFFYINPLKETDFLSEKVTFVTIQLLDFRRNSLKTKKW